MPDITCSTCGATETSPSTRCRFCQTALPRAEEERPEAEDDEVVLETHGTDPLEHLLLEGTWRSIREGHQLLYVRDRDRILDFEPSRGAYRLWSYDRDHTSEGPLVDEIASGVWSTIKTGHELISLGGDHLLDWEPSTGEYRVWWFDADATGDGDILPSLVTNGSWESIRKGKKLVYLGEDRLLDWEPSTGAFRIWHYDRESDGQDPLPGGPLVEGAWASIREGHELVGCCPDHVLDWEPGSGNFRLWWHDGAAGTGGDPIPTELAAGNWRTIRTGHRLVALDGGHVLDWVPATGAFRVWGHSNEG